MIFILPVTAYVAIQFPALQTWIAQKTVSMIEDKIDGKIEVERVAISFLNKIMIKNASITDAQGDTLGSIGKLSLTLSLLNMTPGFLEAKRIIVEDGYFNLQIDSAKGSNLARIFRIEPKPVDTTSSGNGEFQTLQLTTSLSRISISICTIRRKTPSSSLMDV